MPESDAGNVPGENSDRRWLGFGYKGFSRSTDGRLSGRIGIPYYFIVAMLALVAVRYRFRWKRPSRGAFDVKPLDASPTIR